MQIVFTCLDILFTGFQSLYEIEFYIGDVLSLVKLVNIWSIPGHVTLSENVFWFLNYTALLQHLLNEIFTLIACVEIDILREELYTRKYFRKNHGFLHHNVYRIYSSKTIHNVSLQLMSCQKICKKYALTCNRELCKQILQTLSVGVRNVSIEPLIRAWKFS